MKRMKVVVSCLLTAAILLSGCGGGGAGGEGGSTGKDTLTVAIGGEPTSLDPQGSSGMNDRRVTKQIYDTLVTQDAEMNIQPGLATEWEYEDDTTIVFHLRENVKWHNGEDFTAADVLYSLKRAAESDYSKSYADMIDIANTVAVDDYTVSVKLLEPFAPILSNLAFSALSIVNEKEVTEGGDTYGRNPVGTGPFKFVSWSAGDRIELETFDEYWGTKPAFEHLVIRVVTENANRAIELETGGVDIAYEIQANDVDRLEENEETVVSRVPNFAVTFLGFNCDKEPMNNPLVRQAVAYALNTQEIADTVYFGIGSVATGPLPSTVWGYADGLPSYSYNVEKAKELLAQAGITTPLSLTLYTNDATDRTTIAEIVKNQLGQIGMEVEIQIIEQATFLGELEKKEEDMYLLSWTTVTGDADFGLYSQYTTESFGASGN